MTSKFDRTDTLTQDGEIKLLIMGWQIGAMDRDEFVSRMRNAGAFEAEINEVIHG